MSILIKNMTMPETCEDCPLQHSEYLECKITGENTWDWENAEAKYKSVNCPLVELPPHGRLIDVSELEKRLYDYGTGATLPIDWSDIANAPTVIEAWEEVSE